MRPPLIGTALPLSEEAYLELGETTERAELFDGNLYLSARGRPRHQFIVGRPGHLRDEDHRCGLHDLTVEVVHPGQDQVRVRYPLPSES